MSTSTPNITEEEKNQQEAQDLIKILIKINLFYKTYNLELLFYKHCTNIMTVIQFIPGQSMCTKFKDAADVKYIEI